MRAAVNVAEDLKKMRETRFLPHKPSMKKMAEDLGMGAPSTYQRYEIVTLWENRGFPPKFVAKLLKLWEGRGNPPIDSDEVLRLGELYEFFINEIAERILLPGARPSATPREMPLITAEQVPMFAARSKAHSHKDNYVSEEKILGPRSFRLVITDGSMEPRIVKGDQLICDPDAKFDPGDYVVYKLDAEIMAGIRQCRVKGYDDDGQSIIELIPANPNYPIITLGPKNPGKIYAVVVQRIESFK